MVMTPGTLYGRFFVGQPVEISGVAPAAGTVGGGAF